MNTFKLEIGIALIIICILAGATIKVTRDTEEKGKDLVKIYTVLNIKTCLETAYAAGLEKPASLEQMKNYIARLPQGITVNGFTAQLTCPNGQVQLPTQFAYDLNQGTPILTPKQEKEYNEVGLDDSGPSPLQLLQFL